MEIPTAKNVKGLYPKLPNLGFKKHKPVDSKVPMHYALGVLPSKVHSFFPATLNEFSKSFFTRKCQRIWFLLSEETLLGFIYFEK